MVRLQVPLAPYSNLTANLGDSAYALPAPSHSSLALCRSACSSSRATKPKRRLFADADHLAYFSPGDFRTKSPTFTAPRASTTRARVRGKIMTLSFVEAWPKLHPNSPYPFVKMKGVTEQYASASPTRNCRPSPTDFTNADFD